MDNFSSQEIEKVKYLSLKTAADHLSSLVYSLVNPSDSALAQFHFEPMGSAPQGSSITVI